MNGYCIKKGNIGLLHLHNRIMILNEDKDSYCRMIGRGLMIMGLGALISSFLSACLNNENYLFILLASSAIGVTMCYYAVFKYNMYRMSIPLSEVHAICYRSPHNPLKKSIFFKS